MLAKNRTHDFRTSRCAGYLLDHSGDEGVKRNIHVGDFYRTYNTHTRDGGAGDRKRALETASKSRRSGTLSCRKKHHLSVDKRWRLQVASSFGRLTRRLSDDVVPRAELNRTEQSRAPGTGGGRMNSFEGGKDKDEDSDSDRGENRIGMVAETKTESKVEGSESPEI